MATVARLVVNLTTNTVSFETGLLRVEKTLAKTGRQMKSIGREISAGISLPFAAAAASAVKFATDFDDSLDKIVGLVGVNREQVNAWKSDIMSLGGQVGKGPRELADAMYFVTSAGLRGADALDTLKASAMGSTAGLGATKDIADTVTSAMNAYGVGNLKAATAAGVLVAAVREGKMEASELSPVMGRLLPIASQMGISFGEVAGTLGALSRLGLKASESSTALRGVFTGLLKPTEEARQWLGNVGLSFEELRVQLREKGLLSVLATLKEKFGDNEAALAKVFPQAEGLVGVLSLIGKNSESANAVISAVAKATGTDLVNAFNVASNSAGVRFNKAMSTTQASLIKLGEIILPTVLKMVDAFTGAVSRASGFISQLDKNTKDWVITLSLGLVMLGPTVLMLGTFVSAVGKVLILLGPLNTAFQFIISSVLTFGLRMGQLLQALWTFAGTDGILSVLRTFTPFSAAIVAAAAVFVSFALIIVDKWDTIKKAWNSALSVITDITSKAYAWLSSATDGFVAYFQAAFAPLKDWVRNYFQNWMADLQTVAKAVHLDGLLNKLLEWGKVIAEAGWNTGADIANSIAGGFSKTKNALDERLKQATGMFKSLQASGTPQMPNMSAADLVSKIGDDNGKKDANAETFETAWNEAFIQVFKKATILQDNLASSFQAMTSSLSDGFVSLFEAIESGTVNLGQIMEGVWQSFKASMFKVIADMLAKWTVMWALEKAHTAASALFKTQSLGAVAAAESAANAKSAAETVAAEQVKTAARINSAEAGFFSAHSIFPLVGAGLAIAAIAIMLSNIGAFAKGGRPPVGTPSLVGERGPELFVPDTAGTIIPNNELVSAAGTALPDVSAGNASAANINFSQTLNITVSSKDDIKAIAHELEVATRQGVSWAVDMAKTINRTSSKRGREQ